MFWAAEPPEFLPIRLEECPEIVVAETYGVKSAYIFFVLFSALLEPGWSAVNTVKLLLRNDLVLSVSY